MSILGSTSLFFFAQGIVPPPQIGSAYGGGFFAGYISHTANGVATHALIVAPRATGATGAGYPLPDNKYWKTSQTITAGTTSTYNGAANTAAMVTAGIANHPAAQFCTGLSIGGYTDWYLPAVYELAIAYVNLKPSTEPNVTHRGSNPYSVPARGSNYTAGNPAQTTVTAFQTGNSERFQTSNHWSSTQIDTIQARDKSFYAGEESPNDKDFDQCVRAFRKVAL